MNNDHRYHQTKRALNEYLTKLVKKGKTPSVQYQLFDKNGILHKFQAGFSAIIDGKEVNDLTTYNAFSITKTFTALAIMQLVEKGKIKLDERVEKYLSDFSYPKNISIRQLLSHTAGIPNPNPLSWVHLEKEHIAFDKKKFFQSIFNQNKKVKFSTNEKFSYSNLGYVLLGQIIESVSKIPYEEFIRENIIKKLGLSANELSFTIHDTSQHAKGYHKYLSLINWIIGFFINPSKYRGKKEGKWQPFNNMYVNGSAYGGLIGIPKAFRIYIQDLLKHNGCLLKQENKNKLFTEQLTNDNKPTGMCLSWFKGQLNGQEYFHHAGGGGGYYGEIRIYPSVRLGSVLMFNRSGMKDERFLDKIDKIYFKNEYQKS